LLILSKPVTSSLSLRTPLLVRSPNWLGDAVMALPAVSHLKSMLGSEPLAVAAPENLAALWLACPFVDQVISLTLPKSLGATATQLRAGKFRSAVLLPNSLRVAAEALFAGIHQRIGYARDGRRLLLTRAVPVPPRNPLRLHQRFYYLDLVTALGGPTQDTVPALRTEPERYPQPVIALCPGAEYGPAKRWPADNFVTAARHFISKHGMRAVIFGAAVDIPVAAELAAQLPEAENRAGKTSLAEFIRALAGAQLVICNDSGAMHLASVLGVPTVAIFGSTEPQMTGPLGPRTQVLRHHVPCSPCFLRECPLDFACMNSITPHLVIAAGELLRRAKKDAPAHSSSDAA
jgi:heptosyltransferase-2